MPDTTNCHCNVYPFPHREGGGKCRGEGWCENCGHACEHIETAAGHYIEKCKGCNHVNGN